MKTVIDKLGRENVYDDGGGSGHWWTPEMMAGTETVEEHLMDGHGMLPDAVAKLTFEQCHTEHDRLHAEAQHNEIIEFMEATGYARLLMGG